MTLSGIENIMQALGWTLVHSIWQIGLVALVFFLIISFLPQQKAEIRYGLGVLSLVLTAVISAGTFWNVFDIDQPPSRMHSNQETSEIHYLEVPERQAKHVEKSHAGLDWYDLSVQSRIWIDQRINWLVAAWLCGILLLSFRFSGSLYYLQRLKKRSVKPLGTHWQVKMQEMADVLMINHSVDLLASGIARVPMMIGHLKPVILIPASMLSGLSDDQLEAIIAHELAHIYRKDYWVNLLQSVLEIIFFFHPAVWWMSSVVRAEREKCCDDLAVSLCGNSLAYVKALARVEEIKLNQPELALAFGGKEGGLLHRIERILQPGKKNNNLKARFVSASLVMLSMLIILSTTETQAIRYGSAQAKEALNWVKTSYLPVELESQLPAMISYQDQEATQSRPVIRAVAQIPALQDTLPRQTKAPKVYSYSFHSNSHDSTHAPMVISIPSIPDLDSLVAFSFSARDSIFRTLALEPDSLSAIIFNSLKDSGFVANLTKASAPGTPMAFSFDTDSAFSSTIHGAMALADSVMNSQFFATTFSSPHFISDSTLEAKLRKLEQQMREREKEMEALMHKREKKLEMLLEEKEAEFRQKEQKMLQQMEQQERVLEQQMRQKQQKLEQQMRKQEIEMQQQQMKMEQEMHKAELEMQKHEEEMRVTNQKIARLESQLLDDGLIQKGERYNLRVRPDQILINGEKISDRLFRKYRKYMEEEDIFSFEKGNNISITRIAE